MSAEITVVSRTQVIEVHPSKQSISVINAGPQGPRGEDAFIGGDISEVVSDLEALADQLALHIVDSTPHPAYDDIPSLTLLFENGLV